MAAPDMCVGWRGSAAVRLASAIEGSAPKSLHTSVLGKQSLLARRK